MNVSMEGSRTSRSQVSMPKPAPKSIPKPMPAPMVKPSLKPTPAPKQAPAPVSKPTTKPTSTPVPAQKSNLTATSNASKSQKASVDITSKPNVAKVNKVDSDTAVVYKHSEQISTKPVTYSLPASAKKETEKTAKLQQIPTPNRNLSFEDENVASTGRTSKDITSNRTNNILTKTYSGLDNLSGLALSAGETALKGANYSADMKVLQTKEFDTSIGKARSSLWAKQQISENANAYGEAINAVSKTAQSLAYAAPIITDGIDNYSKKARPIEYVSDWLVDGAVTAVTTKVAAIIATTKAGAEMGRITSEGAYSGALKGFAAGVLFSVALDGADVGNGQTPKQLLQDKAKNFLDSLIK